MRYEFSIDKLRRYGDDASEHARRRLCETIGVEYTDRLKFRVSCGVMDDHDRGGASHENWHECYDTYGEARAAYDEIDVAHDFEHEYNAASWKDDVRTRYKEIAFGSADGDGGRYFDDGAGVGVLAHEEFGRDDLRRKA